MKPGSLINFSRFVGVEDKILDATLYFFNEYFIYIPQMFNY